MRLGPLNLRWVLTLVPVVLSLAHAADLWEFPFLVQQDARVIDARIQASMPHTLDPRIVIVDVDEKSLAQMGQWPWPRQQLAHLVQELVERQGAAVVAFDFVFAEPTDQAALQALGQLADVLEQRADQRDQWQMPLQQLTLSHQQDQQFTSALALGKVVLGYYFTSDRSGQKSGQLPEPILARTEQSIRVPTTHWDGYGANLAPFTQAATGSGFFNAIADEGGMVRTLPALAQYNGAVYESLALAIWRARFGADSVKLQTTSPSQLGTASEGAQSPSVGALVLRQPNEHGQTAAGATPTTSAARITRLPLDERGAVRIPYRGMGGPQGGSFRYVSAIDILKQRLDPKALKGAIVLVGSTAPGLQDLRSTPAGATFPGVEVHANLLSALLDGRVLYEPDFSAALEVLWIALLGIVLAAWLPRLGAVQALLLGGGLGTLTVLGHTLLFNQMGMVLPLAGSLFALVMALAVNMSYGYFVEGRAKRSLARIFGTYVPPELVQQMLKHPDNYSMRASNQVLTVMFCDLRGFTHMAETMQPSEVQTLLNIVFNRLTDVIRQHQGTIDKYMGDCVMAFWGAPIAQPLHAEMAVKAALDLTQAIVTVNQELTQAQLPPVAISIGIATGLMAVGDMGSAVRRSYTVIGDAVNLGARLQRLCERYGVSILACDTTYAQTPQLAWRPLGTVVVKGKASAVTIYTPDVAECGIPATQEMNV